MMKSVCILGLGYIGLPTGALLANSWYRVMGVDTDARVVETVNRGMVHFAEPDLEVLVQAAVAAGRLSAFDRPVPADVYMICVPTPFHGNGTIPQPNLDYVMDATRSIAGLLKPGDFVILESTSPVGTTEAMQQLLRESGVDVDKIHMAYCPERVLPGRIVAELVENDRVVGGLSPQAAKAVAGFYRTFVRGEVLETDARTAEMCKLAENSYRDANIAFANELSMICAKEGIDVWNLIRLANRHPRVNILQPGAGVGGHCIAVDPWFIAARDPENSRLIQTARSVNTRKTAWVTEQIRGRALRAAEQTGRSPKIACLGLAFKPDVDDLRESPAVQVASELHGEGFEVVAVEPNLDSHEALALVSLEEALESADVVAILVRHRQFVSGEARKKLAGAGALDFCGALGFSPQACGYTTEDDVRAAVF